MTYVLIIVLTASNISGGLATTTAQFQDNALCESAKQWARNLGTGVRAECFPTVELKK